MHHIYIQDRCLSILRSDEDEQIQAVEDAVERFKNGSEDITINTGDPEKVYGVVCSLFREVNAAGGIVTDGRLRWLVIRRNGIWDLPKGHQEEGEDIITTALREVREETGVSSLEIRRLLCTTDHCYIRDGVWHLKHGWWYEMTCGDVTTELRPQLSEGITRAVWVDGATLAKISLDTYPSIAEVIKKVLL